MGGARGGGRAEGGGGGGGTGGGGGGRAGMSRGVWLIKWMRGGLGLLKEVLRIWSGEVCGRDLLAAGGDCVGGGEAAVGDGFGQALVKGCRLSNGCRADLPF